MRVFESFPEFPQMLLDDLADRFQILGPVSGADRVTRLGPLSHWSDLSDTLPLIPPKKVVLPPTDPLWNWREGAFEPPSSAAEATALVGLYPCDLFALEYLDRVFTDDANYQGRRRTLLTVGRPCAPGDDCFCPPRSHAVPCDLFVEEEVVWSGSEAGDRVMEEMGARPARDRAGDRPQLPQGDSPVPSADLASRFAESAGSPLWERVGERCMSCGACSAVCPTCYCYEVKDRVFPDGSVERTREWDNCFFRDHALVAGGHNFRPSRAERLRFRFEHKWLGFGLLRGIASCVGCGRCRKACPVDIDLAAVRRELEGGGAA